MATGTGPALPTQIAAVRGAQPRAPTSSAWSRSPLSWVTTLPVLHQPRLADIGRGRPHRL